MLGTTFTRPRHGPSQLERRRVLTMLGALGLFAGVVAAQNAPAKEPPLDVNQVQPAPADPKPAEASKPAATPGQPEAAKPDAQVQVQPEGPPPMPVAPDPVFDGSAYQVSRFLLEYRSEHPDHPAVDDLLSAEVELGVTPTGFVAIDDAEYSGRRDLEAVKIRLSEVIEGNGGVYYYSALRAVGRAIVGELNRRGVYGVFVQLHPEDIDEARPFKDKRDGKRSELRLIIWTGKVSQVRSISSGERLSEEIEANPSSRVDQSDPVATRIREQSPVQQGDLIRKDDIDAYAFRLNRHPGRRVDVALASGQNPEEVVVDYLIAESKPWSVYAQINNTGTESTTSLRERFGFVHNQLTGHDDVLRVDYITGNFDVSHAAVASYEFPIMSDELRLRPYAQWSQFTAADVGLSDLEFTGDSWGAGIEAIYTIWQHDEMFFDLVGGARWSNVKVNTGGFNEGQDDFFLPYFGARFERITEASVSFAEGILEVQCPEIAGTDLDEIQNLGRLEVDDEWETFKFTLEQSFYLEPILNPRGWSGESGGERGVQTLAHEFALGGRGQYTFGDRLIPNEEEVIGGLYSVRGYPESIAAGDSVVIVTFEYRFHLPRALGMNNPGQYDGGDVGLFGPNFRYTPQQPFGRADWDLILRAFFDAGATKINDAVAGEKDITMYGTGIGAEFQWKRNITARVDWGFALKDVDLEDTNVDSGDNRVHFNITVLY